MSQNNVNYADNPTGPQLMDNYLAKSQENNLTTNSGIQRPTYAKAGTFWINSSANPWVLYFYNGSTDVAIGTISTGSSGTFNVEGVDLSNYVDLTSNQTISGGKIFSSNLRTNGSFTVSKTNITKGTNPESTQYWQFFLSDKNGGGDANSLGKIQTSVDSAGLVQTSMVVYRNTSGTSSERISIYYPTSGSAYTYAPTPATSDNSTKIATTAFVKAQGYISDDSGYVKTTGNQTIGGTKTFTSNIVIKKSNPTLQQDNTSMTKGTAPSANINNYSISYRDNDGKNVGSLIYHYNTNKDVHARLYAYKSSASTDTADVYLRVYYNANGNHGLLFGTENTGSDTNESLTKNTTSVNDVTIPCMGWVNKVLNTSGRGLVTFSKAANGYYKFTSGLIIQWGTTTTADNETTITLPTPFTSANYAVSCTVIANNAAYQRTLKDANSRTTTAFTTYMSGSSGNSKFTWLAIGY